MSVLYRHTATLLFFILLLVGTAFAEDSQTDQAPGAQANAFSPGWRAYLDPATGELMDSPPYGKSTLEMSPKALERFSTSDFGLIEQVLPNGLRLVHLRGRFRQGSVATVNDDGGVSVRRIGPEMFLSPGGSAIHERITQPGRDEEPDHE